MKTLHLKIILEDAEDIGDVETGIIEALNVSGLTVGYLNSRLDDSTEAEIEAAARGDVLPERCFK